MVYTLLLAASRDAGKATVVTKNGLSIIQQPDISREAQTPLSRHDRDVPAILGTGLGRARLLIDRDILRVIGRDRHWARGKRFGGFKSFSG